MSVSSLLSCPVSFARMFGSRAALSAVSAALLSIYVSAAIAGDCVHQPRSATFARARTRLADAPSGAECKGDSAASENCAGFTEGEKSSHQGQTAPSSHQRAGHKATPERTDAADRTGDHPSNLKDIAEWFKKYDQIRKQATMTAEEREQADDLLDRGFKVLFPGFGRISAGELLGTMIRRYAQAEKQMEALCPVTETRELHKRYVSYFSSAHRLFKDAHTAVRNPFRAPGMNLKTRKGELARQEAAAKRLDWELRRKYGIPAIEESSVKR